MARTFWGTILFFDAAKIAPEIALRNTVGIVAPLIAGALTGYTSAGVVAALGAVNVSYSDSRDPYLARARRMLFASLLVGIAVCAGALSAYTSATAILAAALWAFAVGMLVVLGPKAGDLGAITLVTLIIFAARSLSVREAFQSGLLAFGGGLLQTLLSIAIWPVRPHEPERRIIASLYSALAGIAVSSAGADSAPPATGSILSARESLESLAQDHSPAAERLVFALNQAERIRLSLLTLRRLRRRIDRDPRGHEAALSLDRVLDASSEALQSVSRLLAQGRPAAPLDRLAASVEQFRGTGWSEHSSMFAALIRDANYQIAALAGQIRASSGAPEPGTPVNVIPAADRFARVARLRANMTLESSAFRHAVRLAACVGVGDAVARSFSLERSYWLTMTVAIVLKPDFASTFSRGILRVAGTLAGLLLATVLFHILPRGSVTDIALLASFSFVLRGAGPANYGIFVIAISGIVVLLIAVTGVNPGDAIVARAVNTTLGGALALAAYWIWPTWERTQTGPVLAEMLKVYREYFDALMNALLNTSSQSRLEAARLAGRLARSNAEASVGRFGVEPGVSAEQTSLLNEILVSSHAFVRAAMAIESDLDHARDLIKDSLRQSVNSFAAVVDTTLNGLADALRNSARIADDLPGLRAAWTSLEQAAKDTGQRHALLITETDRIATSLNTLREQVARWRKIR